MKNLIVYPAIMVAFAIIAAMIGYFSVTLSPTATQHHHSLHPPPRSSARV